MTKLSDLKIDEVSLVRKGANQHAKVTIAKSVGGEPGGEVQIFDNQGRPIDPDSLEHGDIVFDAEGQAYQYDDDDTSEDADEEDYDDDELLAGAGVEKGIPIGAEGPARSVMGGYAQVAGRKMRKGASVVSGFAAAHPKTTIGAGIGAAGAGGYGIGRASKSFQEEFGKSLTDGERDTAISKALAYIDELEIIAKSAQQVAEEEREARRDTEFFEVAKTYDLPVETSQLAKTMKNVVDLLDDDDIETIQKCFQYASEVGVFDEIGSIGGGDNSDVMMRLEQMADNQVSKSEGVTREQLLAKSFELDPDAYELYLAEQNQG